MVREPPCFRFQACMKRFWKGGAIKKKPDVCSTLVGIPPPPLEKVFLGQRGPVQSPFRMGLQVFHHGIKIKCPQSANKAVF